jgi:hypothetical protein
MRIGWFKPLARVHGSVVQVPPSPVDPLLEPEEPPELPDVLPEEEPLEPPEEEPLELPEDPPEDEVPPPSGAAPSSAGSIERSPIPSTLVQATAATAAAAVTPATTIPFPSSRPKRMQESESTRAPRACVSRFPHAICHIAQV